jgi:hypothetical protein
MQIGDRLGHGIIYQWTPFESGAEQAGRSFRKEKPPDFSPVQPEKNPGFPEKNPAALLSRVSPTRRRGAEQAGWQ